jgi:tripartite-type tricarboxylate transporter receptor subunit TctC
MQSRMPGRALGRVLVAIAAMLVAGATVAQAWPERPIRLVVPFPPGGGADVAARTYADKLAGQLGQPVIIDNRPGASGNIGAETVARAPADGYTLLFGNEFLATNPLMFRNARFDTLKDFVPIAKVASTPAAIAAHPSLPVKSMAELIALGRSRPLSYATPGIGTGPALFGQLIALQTGARFDSVPYKGSAPAVADAVGGQVDFIVMTLSPMLPHIAAGRLRALAVTSASRSASVPDVPTLAEVGDIKDRYDVWYGVVAPSGTPGPVVDRLLRASTQVLQDPEVLARLRGAGYDVEPAIGEAFGDEIRRDMARWQRVIADAGIPRE